MLTLDKSTKQAKSFSAKTIMKDYKLSSLISDAIQSPVGSTKRKRASALLKSLRKTRENNNYRNNRIALMQTPMMQDGKGGLPGLPGAGVTPTVGQLPLGNIDFSGSMGVPSLTQKNPSFNEVSTQLAAQGLTVGGMISGRPLPTFGAPQSTFSTSTSITPTSGTPKMSTMSSLFSNMFDFNNVNTPELDAVLGRETKMINKYSLAPGDPLSVINNTTGQKIKRWDEQGKDLLQITQPMNVVPNTPQQQLITQGPMSTASTAKGPMSTMPKGPMSMVPTATPLTAKGPMSTMPKGPMSMATPEQLSQIQGSGIDSWTQETTPPEVIQWASSWYNSLNPEDQERFASLYKAVNTGMGPEAFAYAMMGDREEMHKMFPSVPVDQLPMGASLSRQIVDLKKRVREEEGLNKLEVEMNAMQSRGYSALPVLSDYIAGRDQYLGKIDKMIADTKDKLTTMDTSDPTLAKSMDDYTGYLYVLKGRQNKRYGDFLQQSIDAHNAEADRLNDRYKTVSARYQDEIANQSAIAQEDFNSWKTLLGGIYTGVDNWEKRQLERNGMVLANEKVAADMIIDATKAAAAIGGVDPKNSYIQNPTKYDTAIESYLQSAGSFPDPFSKSTNQPTEFYGPGNGTIEDMMELAAGGGLDTNGVIDGLRKFMNDNVQRPLSQNGDVESIINPWIELIKQHAATSTRETATEEAYNLTMELESVLKNGLNEYLTNKAEPLKLVLADLVDTGGWFKGTKYETPESRDEFIANNKVNLPESLLGRIFDTYNMGVLQGGGDPEDFYNEKMLPEDMTSSLSRNIATLIKRSWMDSLTE